MSNMHYDAIVVGSGITGGWAVKELAERGLHTLLLERGRWVENIRDYTTFRQPPYAFRFRLLGDQRLYARDYYVQSRSTFFNEATQQFFVNDRQNPYSYDPDKPFTWIRGHQLGGRSLTWGHQSYRMAPLNFEENVLDGHGADWPVRYDDLAPWYSYVERFIGVSGAPLDVSTSPNGVYQKPMEMNVVERRFSEEAAKRWADRPVTMARTATLTEPIGSRAACQYCDDCQRGCRINAYFCTLGATLPAALATGKVTVKTDSIVHSVIHDSRRGRAAGVRVIDAGTGAAREYRARIVVLCASAFESVRILLNSADHRFPQGLANSSGVLGKYIMDHFFSDLITAESAGPAVPAYMGGRPAPLFIPRFRNVGSQRKDYVRGYQVNGGASPGGWERALSMKGVGSALKQAVRRTGPWNTFLVAQGECLPRAENAISLDPVLKDAWGIPAPRINMTYGGNERSMRKDMSATLAEMLEETGHAHVRQIPVDPVPGSSIHEMGGARMGRDPRTSVLNAFNQTHDIPNLLVTDGAAMASTSCANPSLTYMALTARACAHIVDELKRGNV